MNKKFLFFILLISAILVVIGYLMFANKKLPENKTMDNKIQTGDVQAGGSNGSVDLVRPPFLDE